MANRRKFLALGGAAALAGCSPRPPDTSRAYGGPPVTSVIVEKSQRQLFLISEGRVIRSYEIDLGFASDGPKQFEGDGRTPEGVYTIDRRNPESAFYLSLGISYPNEADVERAKAAGREPGGDIFIHGQMPGPLRRLLARQDWTLGCIAVKNYEMQEIYWMVPTGTPILLTA